MPSYVLLYFLGIAEDANNFYLLASVVFVGITLVLNEIEFQPFVLLTVSSVMMLGFFGFYGFWERYSDINDWMFECWGLYRLVYR